MNICEIQDLLYQSSERSTHSTHTSKFHTIEISFRLETILYLLVEARNRYIL